MKDNSMTAVSVTVGALISAIWIGVGALYLHDAWAALSKLSNVTITTVLLRENEAVAFFWLALGYFWLVIGYFHQGSLIRRNWALWEKAANEAATALQIVETERHKQRDAQLTRLRAAQPRWEAIGCTAYKEQREINLRNLGAPASNLSTSKEQLQIVVMLSNTTFVDRGQDLTIKVLFTEHAVEEFEFALEYCDAAGEQRRADVKVSAVDATVRQEEF